MRNINYIWVLLLLLGCSQDDVEPIVIGEVTNLAQLVTDNPTVIDNVIACASGSENPDEIIAYAYPRPGATDLRYFETENVLVDKNDYTNYTQVDVPAEDFFNGYLMKFTRQTQEEKWVIISFRESDSLHISNPIRLKHQTTNTQFTNQIAINQEQSSMPLFQWNNLSNPDNAIYFQVVSDTTNELLSGTYTFEEQFQYYFLDNVVLNITQEVPPPLLLDTTYQFTLMGVSEDNWVNVLGERSFDVQ